MNEKIIVKGDVDKAFRQVRKDTLRGMRPALRKAAEPIRATAASLFSVYDAKSARGYKIRVRMRGVAVEQSLKRTTGDHPNFGSLNMSRALVPALEEHRDEVVKSIDELVDLAAHRAGF